MLINDALLIAEVIKAWNEMGNTYIKIWYSDINLQKEKKITRNLTQNSQ